MTQRNINHPGACFLAGEQAAGDHHRRPPSRRDRASSALRRYLASAFQSWQRHRTIAALESLDDWMLDDIGITRAEIPLIAAEVVDNSLPSQTAFEQETRAQGNVYRGPTGDRGDPVRNSTAVRGRNKEAQHGTS